MLRTLVDRAKQGDEEAFGALIRAVGDRCIFIAHRILTNACHAEARRSRRFAANVVLLETDEPAAGDGYLTVDDHDQLDRGFRRLPPEQRAILVFHHALGLTMPEVADHLGIPLGTAKSRLSYATAAIRAALEADARTPFLDRENLA